MTTFSPYKLGLGFGAKAPTPSGTEHGQDIEVPLGTPLAAGIQGVAHVHTDNVLGRYVVVEGSNGLEYWFGHLSKVAVKDGQKVDAATQLGLTGGAQNDPQHGDATGPHLWFGVRQGGVFVNPLQHLNQEALFSPATTSQAVPEAAGAEQPAPDAHANLTAAAGVLANLLAPQLGVPADKLAQSLSSVGMQLRGAHQADANVAAQMDEGKFSGVHQAVSDLLGGYQPNEAQAPEHLAGMMPPPVGPPGPSIPDVSDNQTQQGDSSGSSF